MPERPTSQEAANAKRVKASWEDFNPDDDLPEDLRNLPNFFTTQPDVEENVGADDDEMNTTNGSKFRPRKSYGRLNKFRRDLKEK